MSDEEIKDWLKFQSSAIGQLEHFLDRQNFIGLGIDPSFDKKERLFVSKSEKDLKWTYNVWNSTVDYERIKSSHDERIKLKLGRQIPTIHSIRGKLDNDFYAHTEGILENLTLKPFVKMDLFGLDGTSRTIFIGGFYRQTTFSWWEDLPTEWTALQPILADLYKNLEIARKDLSEKLDSN